MKTLVRNVTKVTLATYGKPFARLPQSDGIVIGLAEKWPAPFDSIKFH